MNNPRSWNIKSFGHYPFFYGLEFTAPHTTRNSWKAISHVSFVCPDLGRVPTAFPPLWTVESAISATSFIFDHFYHFVIGVTGIEGNADPAGKAETGTVIVGETFGVLLAVSSMTSSAYPEV
jgi:hypothetical protein